MILHRTKASPEHWLVAEAGKVCDVGSQCGQGPTRSGVTARETSQKYDTHMHIEVQKGSQHNSELPIQQAKQMQTGSVGVGGREAQLRERHEAQKE